MAWKLRKDKLPEDTAPNELGENSTDDLKSDTSSDFSFNDTAVEEPHFMPDLPEPGADPFSDPAPAEEVRLHVDLEEPHFTEATPNFAQSGFSTPTFQDDPAPFNPFVPFQPDESHPSPQSSHSSIDRDGVAFGLISQDDETGIPRVAPFIVDVPPAAQETNVKGALIVRIGNLSANYTLSQEVTTIGRPDSVAQSYPDIEIELDDAVSRRHAEVHHRDEDYYLIDLMSTNGTLLNGERILGGQEQRLLPGDRIHMGDRTEIIFE